tara:strand:+ start:1867 stop:2427 length:561 start_codon:yes stop_codon:yes gene_type:complete
MPLSFPNVGIQSISLRLKRAVAVTSSPFTFDQQVFQHQGAIWEAEVSLPPLSHAEARSVEAFIVGLKGRSGTFTFNHPLHTSTASVITAGIGAVRSETLTSTAGSSAVEAGTYFQAGNYLYMVTSDKAAGVATLSFQPPLRTAVQHATVLNFSSPKSLFRLASNDIGWSTDIASMYGFSFAFTEAL